MRSVVVTMPTWIEPYLSLLRGQFRINEVLAPHMSWRVGGAARYFYQPYDAADLATFIQLVPAAEALLWVGLGSNTLIRDGGFVGVVIATQGCLVKMEALSATTLRAEAGVGCGQLARWSARLSLTGIEFLAGVPGTVGGALAMNAGCFGGETWSQVTAVETIDRSGQIRLRPAQDFATAYREVKRGQNEWFIAGHFSLRAGDKTESFTKIRTLLDRRAATQPTGEPSCGSVFRNPAGDYSARLIEVSGLKGYRIGGACVSTKHANFIVNEGTATAQDIELLIAHVANEVEAKQGIRLIPEVHVFGEGGALDVGS
jgi:UDP-N-acetylmuramate dehydrogenase